MINVIDSRQVFIEQLSEEWHDWRALRYSASDAPAVMAVNPWFPRTPLELYQRHTGQKAVSINAAMRAGTIDEDKARRVLSDMLGHNAIPACWQATVDGLPFACSYDALVEKMEHAYEIKRPMKGSKSDLWLSEDPGHYIWQMAHQLLINPSIEHVSLAIYAHDIGQIKVCGTISRHSESFQAQARDLVAAWKTYDKAIFDMRAPDITDRDVVEVNLSDGEFEELATRWLAAKRMAEDATEKMEQYRKDLLEAAEARGQGLPVVGFGVRAYKTVRAGAVNWKAPAITEAVKAAGIDLETLRGKPIESWTLREEK